MRKRTWTDEKLKNAVALSKSIRQTIAKLGLRDAGGNYEQVKRVIREQHLSTKHFSGQAWNKGLRGVAKPRVALADILRRNSTWQSYKLKKRLFAAGIKTPRCEQCGWAKQATDGRIPVELDHINGDRYDNRAENLRILCPNCHSLQLTHRGLNREKRPG
ncbi:MAG: HNH endonuclease signature motif containing protein [Patescibacteria group bacterium]